MDKQLIIEAYEQVINSLNFLCCHILDDLQNYPLWIDNGAGELESNRDKLVYALKYFKPTQGLSPQETFACPGAVGATLATAAYIKQANHTKLAFNHTMKTYLKFNHIHDTAIVRQILADAGYSGIKLKQVCRQIVMLDFHPRRIAFTKARNGSNTSITVPQAAQHLVEAGQGLHIDVQLAKLSLLPTHGKLVVHRDIRPYWAVNMSTFKDDFGRSKTIKKHTSLPVFYLHDRKLTEPQVLFSRKNTRHKPGFRADKQLEDNPFLPSISAYRYKKIINPT